MRGIVLAGGTGTRLRPLTKILNKHILPVGRYPMIYHPLHALKTGGIFDVMIISGKEHMGTLISQLGSGADFGMNFTFKIQDKPDGIAGALKLCEDFIRTDKDTSFVVILGDNIFLENLDFGSLNVSSKFIIKTKTPINTIPTCKLFLKKVKDPNRFGVVKFINNNGDKVIKIIEKPKVFVSNYAVAGCYVYDFHIWNVLNNIKLSFRNEYEITDVNNWYVENGAVYYKFLKSEWFDAGTIDSLVVATNLCKDITYKDFLI